MLDDSDVVDQLELAEDKRLSVVATPHGLAAIPTIRDGQWRRALPGDGVAEALLTLLATTDEPRRIGNFSVRSWAQAKAFGERAVGVDQTNESVIVGDLAVVKWATHVQDGPHPAPRRTGLLRDGGFTGMPAPWGLVTWHPPGREATLVANVDEYVPGAVDGWTWAVDEVTAAARDRLPGAVIDLANNLGRLIAQLHACLGATATRATPSDAARWRDDALQTLEAVCTLDDSPSVVLARARRADIAAELDGLGDFAGTTVIEGHGDLHVGQILRSADRLLVTDFDGNPVLPAAQRGLPIPAALDVAGMTQSLAHAAIVARKHTVLDTRNVTEVDDTARDTFQSTYEAAMRELHCAHLYEPALLKPLRLQQVLREILYANRHLPRWMYVPDAALPALLDQGVVT